MTEFFCHLPHIPLISSKFLEHAKQLDYETPAEHGLFTKLNLNSRSGPDFKMHFLSHPFYIALKNAFPNVMGAVYAKTNAGGLYDWHTDKGGVTTGINILLSESKDCLTLFRTKTDIPLQYNIYQCDYEQFRPTVFDSTVEHCVINLSQEPRYLLRVPIADATYKEVRDYLLAYRNQ
jgi:hypothetical protein